MEEREVRWSRLQAYIVAVLLLLVGVAVALAACTSDQWLQSAPIGRTAPPPANATGTTAPTAVPSGPTASVAAGSPAFGLAWFHKPPEDGTTPQQLAAQVSYIHLTASADVPYMKRLRDAGYKGPIYTYLTSNGVEGPGPYKNSAAQC